jgi:hypothetical protein
MEKPGRDPARRLAGHPGPARDPGKATALELAHLRASQISRYSSCVNSGSQAANKIYLNQD